jgi:opacity protein-like surface antigen
MRTRSLLAALALLAAARTVNAQKPQTREGFTISFGIGTGTAGFTCDGCSSDRNRSATGYLRLGGAIRSNLIIAGEANDWSKEESGLTFTVATVNAIAQWYPATANGFFLSGGVGIGSIKAEVKSGSVTVSQDGTGLGYQVGAGYDWRVGKKFSLTPFATYFATSGIEFEGDKLNGNVFHFGLGFTWH